MSARIRSLALAFAALGPGVRMGGGDGPQGERQILVLLLLLVRGDRELDLRVGGAGSDVLKAGVGDRRDGIDETEIDISDQARM